MHTAQCFIILEMNETFSELFGTEMCKDCRRRERAPETDRQTDTHRERKNYTCVTSSFCHNKQDNRVYFSDWSCVKPHLD
ncbi:hypothetical protein scyTo_0003189 [Scyliorhinus torazame]|uniref:Uncharacterized protein n=1 Tax=Scyliorhinus torazame TaxID=75743 RepID=A0A401PLU1_SCYTO|nr:hypothetical protein [Scyliorhinus torazame]